MVSKTAGQRTCPPFRASACRAWTRACSYPQAGPASEADAESPLARAAAAWERYSRPQHGARTECSCPHPTRCRLGVSGYSLRHLLLATGIADGAMGIGRGRPAAAALVPLPHQHHRSDREQMRSGSPLGHGKHRVPNACPHHSKRRPVRPSARHRVLGATTLPALNVQPHLQDRQAQWLHEQALHSRQPTTPLDQRASLPGLG